MSRHDILKRERPWRPSDPAPSAGYGFAVADVTRLQRENAAMRDMLRQLAHGDYTIHGFGDFCGVCKHDGENIHDPSCPVERARAFLTNHPPEEVRLP